MSTDTDAATQAPPARRGLSALPVSTFVGWLNSIPHPTWRRLHDDTVAPPRWWRRWILVFGPFAAALAMGVAFGWWLALPAAMVATFAVLLAARAHTQRYRRDCQAALPDALSLMAAGLVAGHTLQQSLNGAVRAGGPLSAELTRVQLMIRLGETVPDALTHMAKRIRSPELEWVAIAIRINAGVGGDLGSLLTTIAATIRDRDVLRRTARVLSAEGRLSAWVLGCLPPGFVLLLLVLRPEHLEPLTTDRRGWAVVASAVALFAIGLAWLRRAVRLEV